MEFPSEIPKILKNGGFLLKITKNFILCGGSKVWNCGLPLFWKIVAKTNFLINKLITLQDNPQLGA